MDDGNNLDDLMDLGAFEDAFLDLNGDGEEEDIILEDIENEEDQVLISTQPFHVFRKKKKLKKLWLSNPK